MNNIIPGLPENPLPNQWLQVTPVRGIDPIQRRREIRLMDVRAKGPRVLLILKDTRTRRRYSKEISRKQALERAHAIRDLHAGERDQVQDIEEMRRMLIAACREAYRNATGNDYQSSALQLMDAQEKHSAATGETTW